MGEARLLAWPLWFFLATFALVTLWLIFWPRTFYENQNPFLRGEDYWFPFHARGGRPYTKFRSPIRYAPRLWQRPETFARSDLGIERAVCARLRACPGFPWRDVVVRSDRGELRLAGHVPNEALRERAESLAAQVPGVRRVRNELHLWDFHERWGPSEERAA